MVDWQVNHKRKTSRPRLIRRRPVTELRVRRDVAFPPSVRRFYFTSMSYANGDVFAASHSGSSGSADGVAQPAANARAKPRSLHGQSCKMHEARGLTVFWDLGDFVKEGLRRVTMI
jgi:hypothetical protein